MVDPKEILISYRITGDDAERLRRFADAGGVGGLSLSFWAREAMKRYLQGKK